MVDNDKRPSAIWVIPLLTAVPLYYLFVVAVVHPRWSLVQIAITHHEPYAGSLLVYHWLHALLQGFWVVVMLCAIPVMQAVSDLAIRAGKTIPKLYSLIIYALVGGSSLIALLRFFKQAIPSLRPLEEYCSYGADPSVVAIQSLLHSLGPVVAFISAYTWVVSSSKNNSGYEPLLLSIIALFLTGSISRINHFYLAPLILALAVAALYMELRKAANA